MEISNFINKVMSFSDLNMLFNLIVIVYISILFFKILSDTFIELGNYLFPKIPHDILLLYSTGDRSNFLNWSAIASIFSAISAILMLVITLRIFKWDSKRDFIDYVPQLFIRSENKIIIHPVFSESSLANFIVEDPFQISLVNIGDKKIVDLEVKSEVIKNESYLKLLSYVEESRERYIHFYEKDFSYQGTIGVVYKLNCKTDLIDGNDIISMNMPGSFHIALVGYNLMALNKSSENIDKINLDFKISISYNHAFTDERVRQTGILNINFSHFDNNTIVEWKSLLFSKK